MNPADNPYRPGAGIQPPELAGRDNEITAFADLLLKAKGTPERSLLLYGLRGVGKTVLLNEFDRLALDAGWFTHFREIKQGERAFRLAIAEMSRKVLLEMSRRAQLEEVVREAIAVLKSFILKIKVKDPHSGLEWSAGIDPAPGKADSGRLEEDLTDLFVEMGRAARRADTGIVFFIDEAQRLQPEDLSAVLMALHRVNQLGLPVVVIPAGLPQLRGLVERAQEYAERLFAFVNIDHLKEGASFSALETPAARKGAHFDRAAAKAIFKESEGYPFFLQEWGKQVWDLAAGTTVTVQDVNAARPEVLTALDNGFFAARDEQATNSEKQLLRAMARLGNSPYMSGDVVKAMGKQHQEVTALRDRLIKKGLIYSPSRGRLAFAVPQYAAFVRRTYE